jgi:hypothetical protein
MTIHVMRNAVVLGTLLLARTTFAQDCPSYFDRAAIFALQDATTVQQLDRRYHSRSYPDRVADIVYAKRRATLSPESPENGLLIVAAIPRNPAEFWEAYHLSDPAIAEARPELAQVFDRFIADIAQIVSRKSTPDSLMRRYVLLTVFSDGEIAETLAEANKIVLRRNRATFVRAVRQLPQNERQRFSIP